MAEEPITLTITDALTASALTTEGGLTVGAAEKRDYKYQELLNEREFKELCFAKVYSEKFAHGTTGHNQLMLIAHLADILERMESMDQTKIAPE